MSERSGSSGGGGLSRGLANNRSNESIPSKPKDAATHYDEVCDLKTPALSYLYAKTGYCETKNTFNTLIGAGLRCAVHYRFILLSKYLFLTFISTYLGM